ncbi:MAG: hypothetical protein HN742_40825 [Lentisphaerae bacterium]|nr:hypothetical protein [Lentisphaerota bacterium]MBT5606275.1 hypothetical protein [Lentisphaerota bacterium]MBT7059385.1 hypothetical protein [Lentisphaerota bacterium]MBT7848280.1 hypothetical protein [Lentisphaerota bacterium]
MGWRHLRAATLLAVWSCAIAACLSELRAEELQIAGTAFRVDRSVRRQTYQLTWPINPIASKTAEETDLAFVFAFRSPTDFCRVDLSVEGWRVTRHGPEGEKLLGAGRTALPPKQPLQEFVLKRFRNRLTGILGGHHLFRLFDAAEGRGKTASRGTAEGRIGEAKLQALAKSDMVFRDDFMRSPEENQNGVWETLRGTWKLQSFADQWKGDSPLDPMNSSRNANPFVYRGTGTPEAVALAGYPFWDDLAGAVSVRCLGGKAAWLFSYRGPDDYYALRWEPTSHWEQPARFALERMRAGEKTVLAELQLKGQTEQWYRIGIERRGPDITALFQDVPVIRIRDATCIGGRFGLQALGGDVDFDDIDVAPSTVKPLEETAFRRRSWRRPLRRWEFVEDGIRCLPGGWFGGEALLALGLSEWTGYRLAVTVETPARSASTVGISFGVNARESTSFEWESARKKGAERRLSVRAGESRDLLGEAQGGYEPGKTLRLIVDQSGPDLCIYEAMHGLLLRVPKHSVPAGRVGLTVKGRDRIEFRDMILDGPDERDWEQVVKTKIFESDHYMLDWSAAEGEWVLAEQTDSSAPTWWHKGDFFGAAELSLPIAAATEDNGFTAFLMASSEGPETGATVHVRPTGKRSEKLTAELLWNGERLTRAQFALPPEAKTVDLRKDGSFLWLRCGEAEPFFCQLPADSLPDGTRVGLQLASAELLEQLVLKRDHVVDDQFDHVPVRWRKLGRWEVSNKFHCDPRWAYMVGESDALASLWHVDTFPGDVTLEFYAGMRYRSDHNFMPYYPRPGDINAVVSSTGASVFDGYTVVVSGWDTTWTRVLRNGKIVAETDRPFVPSTRKKYVRPQHLHRKWFYVKLRRVGPLVELYFENEKILSWTDEEPLKAGRVALWTVDNSILIARAKISYSARVPFRPAPQVRVEDKSESPSPPAAVDKPQEVPATALRLVSQTHPGVLFTFDTPGDLEGWEETGEPGDARLTWADTDADDHGGSLRASNVAAGGQLRVPVPLNRLDVRRATHLTFACRMDPGTKANLYATIGGKRYVIHLTGPPDDDENLICLGRMPMQADGRWHRLFLALGDVLLKHRPLDRRLVIEDMAFGVERGGYLLAGRGGNPTGTSFQIDDFEIAAQGAPPLKARLQKGTDTQVLKGTFDIRHVNGTIVCKDQSLADGWVEQGLDEGLYTLEVAAEGPAGHRELLRFRITGETTTVESISPPSKADWGGENVTVRLSPSPLPTLSDLVVRTNGRSYPVDNKRVRWIAETRSLVFDAARAQMALTDAKPYAFQLAPRRGGGPPLAEWTLNFKLTEDKLPPQPVRLRDYAIHDTFEYDLGTWARIGPDRNGREHSALLIRDDRLPASGQYSLKLFNELIGGLAGAQVSTKSINAGKHPIISFDCRMEEEVLFDLLFTGGAGQSRITVTDNGHRNTARHVGDFTPTIAADGNWHHLEVNWHDLLAALPYCAGQFSVSNLRVGDSGWTGNRERAIYWIDNFRVAPTLSAAGQGLLLRWATSDPGGIAGYSYHWSSAPNEDPDTDVDGTAGSARFTDIPEGRQFFHIRAVDRAGNWSETTHWLILVDNTPPQLSESTPAADTTSADRELRIVLGDPLSGLDPASLRLTVNGRYCAPGRKGVTVDLKTGLFAVDWVAAGVRPKTVGEAQTFEVVLNPVRDFAGNSTERKSWTWTLSSEGDTRPPPAPRITWANGKVLNQFDFEEDQPKLTASAYFITDRPFSPARGSHVLQTTVGATGTAIRLALPGQVDTSTHRYLSFRYRFPPDLKVDFSGMLETREPDTIWLLTKLTDGDIRPDYVFRTGQLEGITCDNQWHAALIDLRQQVETWHENKPEGAATSFVLKSLAIGDMGFNWHDVGTTFMLDDVVLAAGAAAGAEFAVSSSDESGVTAYACAIDRDPDGLPGEADLLKPGERFKPSFPEKGVWYVHACARDTAGNMSKPGHFTVVVE